MDYALKFTEWIWTTCWNSQRRYGLRAGIHRVDMDYTLAFIAQILTPRWHAHLHSVDIDSELAFTTQSVRSLGSWTEYHLSLETICDNILVLKLFKASQGCTALYTVCTVCLIHNTYMYNVHVRKHICKVRFSSGK